MLAAAATALTITVRVYDLYGAAAGRARLRHSPSPPRRWPAPVRRQLDRLQPRRRRRAAAVPGGASARRDGAAHPGPQPIAASTSSARRSSRTRDRACWRRSTPSRWPNALVKTGVPMPILLGRVTAHEIGHLLLGTNSHAPPGLMQAHLGSARPASRRVALHARRRRRRSGARRLVRPRGRSVAKAYRDVPASERVEQELERPVRLGAEDDLRAEQHQPARCRPSPRRSRRRRRGGPGPTPSRCAAAPRVEPRDRRTPRGAASGPSRNTGLLSNITSTSSPHAPGERVRRCPRAPQHRAGDVELLARQRPLAPSASALDQVVVHRQAQVAAPAPSSCRWSAIVPPASRNCLQLRHRLRHA